MSDAPLMVGVSGLRGIVGKSLTPEVAARFAAAFGGWLKENIARYRRDALSTDDRPTVVVGRDGRAGGERLHEAVLEALLACGCDVIDLGVAMTPTVGVMMWDCGAEGGLVVTASHNPQEWNGLKCLLAGGETQLAAAPVAEEAAQIIQRFQRLEHVARGVALRGKRRAVPGAAEHVVFIYTSLTPSEQKQIQEHRFRVVLDSVNSSGSKGGAYLLRDCGCEFEHLGSQDTGVFPHLPEPVKENLVELCRAVVQRHAAVGFAQDPDGDRLAIVDDRGVYIGEEYTLVLAAEALLGGRVDMKAPGRPRPVLVTNLSTSRMIDDVAARHGAKVIRTAVGEANVVEAMKREKAAGADVVLGGEGNGGVIWPQVTYVRDSLSAMALVLALMARTGKTVSELVAGMPRYAIEKRKVDLAKKEDAVPAVEKIAAHWKGHKVDRQDGVRVDFASGPMAGKAWIHVRASNTEPIMRLIAEAPEAGQAKAILDEAAMVIGR